jgi:hypothetical protein
LELLAASPGGCTEAIMRAHGFTIGQTVALVRAGLARARAERVVAGTAVEFVIVVRITKAGRKVLTADAAMNRNKREPPDPRSTKVELSEILERRPDLKGKSLEAAKRIIRREARLALKPRRTWPSI